MTRGADFKRRVRERMAATGENYTTARSELSAIEPPAPARPPVDPPVVLSAEHPVELSAEMLTEDAAYRKSVRTFFDGEVLREIPARRKARAAVLLHLLTRFEGGREYAEAEVDAILRTAHEDYAWLRRELVNYRYLSRADGRYRMAQTAPLRDANERQEVPRHEAAVIAALNAAAAAG